MHKKNSTIFWLIGSLYLTSAIVFAQKDSAQLGVPLRIIESPQLGEIPTAPTKKAQLRVATTCNRTAIINDYNTNFLGSALTTTEQNWTGSVAGCVAGTVSALTQTRVLQRINYYRRLVGVSDNTTHDNTRNVQTQQAALMMKANNALSHTPPNTWICYTADGYEGANKSNLALGAFGTGAIKLYVDDPGIGNYAAGHRRWILYSRSLTFGHGSTDNSNALWIFNTFATTSIYNNFIAFPAQGYMPRGIIPPRWSFGIPNANFSSSTVQILDELNNPITGVVLRTVANGYGDNTLVWDMPASVLSWTGVEDKVFKVTVSGITGAAASSYTYNVVAIAPSTPSLTIATVSASCGTTNSDGSVTANFDRGAKSYLWSSIGATTQTVSGLLPGNYTVTVTDKNDCTYTASVTLTRSLAASTPTLSTASTTICVGQSTVLNAGNCTGTINWSGGLGTGTSKTVSPTTTTTYTVTCTEGTCTSSSVALTVAVNSPVNATMPHCTPSITSGPNGASGITNFTFNSINFSSGNANTDGAKYIDRSCLQQTTVSVGNTYTISMTGFWYGRIYIDFNNDGDFIDTGEAIVGAVINTGLSTSITIPNNAIKNTPLRIRVLADNTSSSNSCALLGGGGQIGQIEDYAVVVRDCPITYSFPSGMQTANTYSASQTILSQATVANGTFYNAGNSITLSPGFQTPTGGTFLAKIQGCP